MNLYIAASAVLILTGLVHSVVGELMIFRKVSAGSIVPNQSAPPLRQRNLRILWANWHLTTVFGLVLAGVLYKIGVGEIPQLDWLSGAISIACASGGFLVLYATNGRHPGWAALVLASVLTWLAMRSQ